MNLKIRWSEIALLSLAEVLEYTTLMHGTRQASKMRRQVMDGVRRISRSPYMASVEPYSEMVECLQRTMLHRMGYIID